MDITRCLMGISVGAERERERRGLTYSCCTAEEERIRSEVLTCAAAPLRNTGNGEGERREERGERVECSFFRDMGRTDNF